MANKNIIILSKELPPQVGGAGIVAETLYNGLKLKHVDVEISKISNDKGSTKVYSTLTVSRFIILSLFYKTIVLNDLYFKKVWLKLFRGYFAKRCIVYLHGSEPEFLIQDKAYKTHFLRLCINSKRIIAVSCFMKQKLLDAIDDDVVKKNIEAKISIIRNGIDMSIFYNQNFEVPSNPLVIVSASRLVKEKGFFTKANIIKELIEKHSLNIKWHIAGSGPDSDLITNYIDELGLSSYVVFHGAITQQKLADLYNQGHIFLLLSELRESLGLVYMEASSCGCFSIGYERYGVKEAIINDVSGKLVSDQQECITAIVNFYKNYSLSQNKVDKCLDFNRDLMVDAFMTETNK